jgi:hypothetical protein
MGGFVSGGARSSANTFLLDGVDNTNNDSPGQMMVSTNVDAIEEFKVQTANYSAEFGRGGGAVVNAAIKSGTNKLSGSAFFFIRDKSLDARDYFEDRGAPKNPFQFQQFGGTFGGPLRKDRTFFFLDYERTSTRSSIPAISSVPTARMRAGDFSEEGNPVVFDPASGEPFPGNVIPAGRISPLAASYLALFPEPNLPGLRNNYLSNPAQSGYTDQGDLRIDHQFSQNDRLFLRLSASEYRRSIAGPLPGLANGGDYGAGDSTWKTRGGVLSYTRIFSGTTVNELRVGFNRLTSDVGVARGGPYQPPESLRMPGAPHDPRTDGISNFLLAGYTALGEPQYNPTYTLSQELQFGDSLTLIRGRHTLKLGVQARLSAFDLLQTQDPRGTFSFSGEFTQNHDGEQGTGEPTGDAAADALLGLASQIAVQTIPDVKNRTPVIGVFVQDDFKVTSALTLNLGLRYDYTGATIEANDRQSNFDFATGQLRSANQGGSSRGLVQVDKLNLAPRVGFALALTRDGKTALRGGYGIFYNSQEPRTSYQLGFNPPFYLWVSRYSDFGVTPAGLVDDGFPSIKPEDAQYPGLVTLDERVHTPYYQQWNINFERQLPFEAMIEVGYFGSKGSRLTTLRNLNQPPPAPGDVQGRRPYPAYGDFSSVVNSGRSNYHSLQVKLSKRATAGLWFLSAFTYGKATNDQPEVGLAAPFPQDSHNIAAEEGRADFDQRYRWVTSLAWDLPFGRGRSLLNQAGVVDALFGGWQLGGIFTLASGFPFSPTISEDVANVGGWATNRPDQLRDGNLPRGERSVDRWFDVSAYATPAPYSFGNAPRNSIEGPGLQLLDLYLKKTFRIRDRHRLELRIEAFNALNHPNFGQPNPAVDAGEGSAGVITHLATPMRQIQFGARFSF